MKRQPPGIYWFSGLSGSGKTTISVAVAERLKASGHNCFVLDGDSLRHGLCSDLGFSPADRNENIRRAGEVARLIAFQGYVCLCAFITPYTSMRTRLRETLAPIYYEIFLDCPINTCIKRDPKHYYAKVRQGSLQNYTGIDAPYETPTSPDLLIDTNQLPLDVCIESIVKFIKRTTIF